MKGKLAKELHSWNTFCAIMLIGSQFFGILVTTYIWTHFKSTELIWLIAGIMFLSLLWGIPLSISSKALDRIDYSKLDD